MTKHIFIIGFFPPPTNGMAVINKAIHDNLIKTNHIVNKIDISGGAISRTWHIRILRAPKVIKKIILFLKISISSKAQKKILYMGLSGGLGQIYEIFFILIARFYNMKIYIHHHSFAYIYRKSTITKILFKIAGRNCTHISLCSEMCDSLKSMYNIGHYTIVSNAVFLLEKKQESFNYRTSLKSIGFLSNINAEKGIFEFLEIARICENEKLPITFKIAGPIEDKSIQDKIFSQISIMKNIDYIGSVYGDEKSSFFSSIDLLIFPTKYKNEADSLINYEALLAGIPIIAYGRGCIPSVIDNKVGLVIPIDMPFVSQALPKIKYWLESDKNFQEASKFTIKRFKEIYDSSIESWTKISNEIQ